jgi:signal transduction histidine kinase
MARGDGTLLPGVLEAIAQAVRSPGAAVRRRDGEVMASYGLVPPTAAPIVLRVADRDLGELLVAPRSGETGFAGADRRLLSTIAPMLAVVVHAVALAEDLERERQRVVDATQAERGRLRQDLHDGLGPSLTGVGLGLEALETRLAGAHDRDQAMVARLRSEVAGAIEEVRRIIDDLRPTALDGADLVSALRARAAALNQSGLQVEVVVPQGMPSLDSDVEATVYRVVDEALNNVVRHAQATRCRVVLAATDALRVEVQDDGIGLPDNRGRRGVGLDSMRTRAERLGGTFTAARRGVGTSVVLEVPLVPA